jgi:HAE1 family hydrophobic/amphiphilic exporter-1
MRISRFAVHRPVFTIMIVLIVLILGVVSLLRLPIDLMPDITYPTLSVSCQYSNASPEVIEELITRPIERAVAAVPGVEEITSTSSEGSGSVRVTFSWGTDLDAAASDVRDRLDRVIRDLPDDAERPVLRKFDLASFPVLILGASSKLDPVEMRRLIDDQVTYRLERVPGVAAVDVRGGHEREIHVDLKPEKIKSLGLRLDRVMAQITASNVNLPAGTIERGDFDVTIRTPGEFVDLNQLRNTVIEMRGGAPIRVGDVADVKDSWIKETRRIRVDGQPGLRMAVNKQSGKNTVEVARGVLAEIERINQEVPQVKITPIIDTSSYIQRSIGNLGISATFGGILAVCVLLFFLRNLRSTIVIATAIPVSIIATFTLMYFGGFTLNMMTLGGLALGIGMLLDNSIVVFENIYRLYETGQSPEEAAINGADEVTAAIIASTLTTLVVFLPLIFVRGMSGVMFKQLCIVVAFALACSLIVALTVVPMLAARILKRRRTALPLTESLAHKIFRVTGNLFSRTENGYKKLLHLSLNHRWVVVAAAALLLAGSIALIPLVGVELMPSTDEGEVRISGEMQVGTRLDVMEDAFQKIEQIVHTEVPEASNVVTTIGGSFQASGSHKGEMRIALVPAAQRHRTSDEIAGLLRGALRNIPGMTIRTRAGQGLFLLRMGSAGEDRIQVEIRGHDLLVAEELADQVKRIVEDVPGVTDAQISLESGSPEEEIVIDRSKAADQKLSVTDIAAALQTVLSGTLATNFREAGDEFPIRVEVQGAAGMGDGASEQASDTSSPERNEAPDTAAPQTPAARETKGAGKLTLDRVLDLTVINADGEPVVLRNVVDVRPRSGPVSIARKDQERIVTVSANLAGRDMGSVIADIRTGLEGLPVPQGFSIRFGGDYEEQQKAFGELLLSIILALVLVYTVMACQYESLRDPFVVMFAVPLAVIGVVLMLLLTNTTFNIQSFIGCVMLGGIVVNNAILLVDHTNLLRRRDGMELRAAIEEAGRRRLRPILMTALTTVLGLTPLALALGEGGEAQAPLARAVIGGLLSSTLITLVFVPVVYSLFERRMSKQHTQGEPHA